MPSYAIETALVVLLVLWVLGAFVYPVGGGMIHALLLVVAAAFVFRIFQGRRSPV